MAERARRLDPVTLEILWSRLIGVTGEQAAALMRTSFTPVVRESADLSAAVFDTRGRMLAQAAVGTPGHINSLATGMRHFLARFPGATLRPGDVLITNDPWMTSGQLNDLSVVTPVFRGRTLAGYFGNCCHAMDIGGRGLSADASEVYEEGLYIPLMKLYDRGRPNQSLLDLLAANVRAPAEVLGDLQAQVAGNRVGAERLLGYLAEFEMTDLDELGGEILRRSETAMRAAIRAVPDGEYEHSIVTDGLDEPLTIRCHLSVRGGAIEADYSGSSAQTARGMNVVLNYTTAYTNFALKCAICPQVPNNEGSFRPVRVSAPEGSVLNPRFPAPVAARHIVGHLLPFAVFGALAQVLPERVVAEGSGNIWLTMLRGQGRNRFVAVMFNSGGTGARPDRDGLSATSFPSGIQASQVEVIEASSPVVIRRKALRPGSGGDGRYRGGLGQEIEIEVRTGEPFAVSVLCDHLQAGPAGYRGGGSGSRGALHTANGQALEPKVSQVLAAGTRVVLELPGGGGFHDPAGRDPGRHAEDAADGLL